MWKEFLISKEFGDHTGMYHLQESHYSHGDIPPQLPLANKDNFREYRINYMQPVEAIWDTVE